MKTTRGRGTAAVLALLWVVGIYSCPSGRAQGLDKYGGTLRIGQVAAGIRTLNPIFATLKVERKIGALIFNGGLLEQAENGHWVAGLADLPVRSRDGRNWTFQLRPGISFSDGKALDAQDVWFTYNLYKSSRSESAYLQRYFGNIRSIQAKDERTITFTLNDPDRGFPYDVALIPILPRYLLQGRSYEEIRTSHPIGLGPYQLEQWQPNQTIVLRANPSCYKGPPFLDRLIFRFYRTHKELVAAFVKRAIDVIEVETQAQYMELRKLRAPLRLYDFKTNDKEFMALFYNNRKEPFQARNFRVALTYALDRERIITEVMGDKGHLAHGPVDEGSWAYFNKVHKYRYNPKKALQLLAEMRWQDRDRDGILDREGRPLMVRLLFTRGSDLVERIVRLVKLNLSEVLIQVIPEPLEEEALQERLRTGAYEAALVTQRFEADADSFYELFRSRRPDGTENVFGYRNREVDRLIDQAYVIKDREGLRATLHRLQLLISQDQPCTFLCFVDQTYLAFDLRLFGFVDSQGRIAPFSEWYVPSQLR